MHSHPTGPCDGALISLRERIAALEGVQIRPYAHGQEGVFHRDTLIGHLHRSGVVGIACGGALRDELIGRGQARVHHDDPDAPWIVLTLDHAADLNLAVRLLQEFWLAHCARSSLTAWPVPTERPA
ncbi:luciferase domain-containing protein [Deinococcus alpinitundrae]|uniref:luciferase domain-containing protein n=1 Tax=Deinococcus alpinitundrae TaxID=468913 RepID=UPI00137B3424|nr:luciferase family protein [Deinococcus alpinitundrae]